jgi:hypothetical protein
MWSLPDLIRLNSEAAAKRKLLERAVRIGKLDGKKIPCDHADYDGHNCSGSILRTLWFDIFSNDPKGILAQCEYHRAPKPTKSPLSPARQHRLLAIGGAA